MQLELITDSGNTMLKATVPAPSATERTRHFFTAGFYATGTIVAVNLLIGDRHHEAHINPADPAQLAMLDRLSRQRALVVRFERDEDNEEEPPAVVELAQSNLTRAELVGLLRRVQAHRSRGNDWQATVLAYQQEVNVPWATNASA